MVAPSRPIRPAGPRVTADGGHFELSGDRYRAWGVNLCFGANLPPATDAERVAQRLAAVGFNSVRLHHLDTQPFPDGVLDPADPRRLHPEAGARLDALVDQLARHGLRVNLNLHVGRAVSRALGLPAPGTDYDKIVDLFTPALIDAQKDYARALLSRTNALRGTTWAADPAVAFVEISNEDSLFMWDADKRLRTLPAYYADILQHRYVDWLRQHYRTTDRLRNAWALGAEKTGSNVLTSLVCDPGDAPSWQLESHLPSEATLEVGPLTNRTLKVRLRKTDRMEWHVQLKQSPLSLEAGRYYTLTYRARAACARPLSVGVSMDHDPWTDLGLWHWSPLTTNWSSARVGFTATTNEARARLSFVVGGTDGGVEIADVALRPGGRIGLAEGETLEKANIRCFGPTETRPRTLDRLRFLADTEKAYFDEMRRFIRNDLHCEALVTGTAVFGPISLYTQSGMDYVDAHAYWQHPRFPGRAWDPSDWIVEQQAMVDYPEWSTLPGLACGRLDDKPYTVSEYNHPAPNDYQAECIPFIASTAALQDWDGVWLFAYSHRSATTPQAAFDSFFDIEANPAKLGFVPAGAALFRDGALPPFRRSLTVGAAPHEDPLTAAVRWQQETSGDLPRLFSASAVPALDALKAYRLAATWKSGRHLRLPTREGDTPTLHWSVTQGKGTYSVQAPGALVWVGWSNPAATSGVRIVSPPFTALTLAPVAAPRGLRRLLVTACGRCEATDMGFSADRRSVGRNWGRPPVRIQPVNGVVPLPQGNWRAWPLDASGARQAEIPVLDRAGQPSELHMDASRDALWYLLESP